MSKLNKKLIINSADNIIVNTIEMDTQNEVKKAKLIIVGESDSDSDSDSEEEPKEPHAILSKFKQKDKSSKEMLKLNMNLVIFERKLGHVASRTESNSFKHEMFDITKLGYK